METPVLWCFIFSVLLSVSYSQLIPPRNGTLLDTVELMALHGFKGERHEVKSQDGYKLVIFRILPAKLPAPVILIEPGLSLSSDVFVMEKNALALILSKKGYDVWLGNTRGNVYSHSHEKISYNDTKFWDFSYDEMGYYDVPAHIDYILGKTKQPSLYYIGHSMGFTMFFVMGSTRSEYNSKVKAAIALAPVAFFTGKLALFAKQPSYIEMSKTSTDKWIKEEKVEVMPRKEWANENGYHQVQCSDVPENFISMCDSLLEMATDIIGGPYFPAGMSLKNLLHYRQNILTDSFKRFDYGSEEGNKAAYKSATPPDYNLKLVTAPLYLVYGPNDVLVDQSDIDILKTKLPNIAKIYKVPDEKFGHTDYIFVLADEDEEDRTHFRLELYDEIIKWLNDLEKM